MVPVIVTIVFHCGTNFFQKLFCFCVSFVYALHKTVRKMTVVLFLRHSDWKVKVYASWCQSYQKWDRFGPPTGHPKFRVVNPCSLVRSSHLPIILRWGPYRPLPGDMPQIEKWVKQVEKWDERGCRDVTSWKRKGNKKMPTPRQTVIHNPIPTWFHVAQALVR